MFKKISIPLLLFFVSACVFNSTEIGRTKEKFSDFFLCFPETDIAFNRLSFEEQVLIRKKIADEKRNRKFNCSEFQNFKGVRENIDKLNEQNLSRLHVENLISVIVNLDKRVILRCISTVI